MSVTFEIIVSVLIVVGAAFTLIGSFGLIRLPDFMIRLHSPTKATTLGVGALLCASIMYFFNDQGLLSINELMITLFLFLTAPISAHFMARAHLHEHCRNPRQELPPLPEQGGWSIFEDNDSQAADQQSVSQQSTNL